MRALTFVISAVSFRYSIYPNRQIPSDSVAESGQLLKPLFFIGKSPGSDCALIEQSLRAILRFGGTTIRRDFVRFAQISAHASLPDER